MRAHARCRVGLLRYAIAVSSMLFGSTCTSWLDRQGSRSSDRTVSTNLLAQGEMSENRVGLTIVVCFGIERLPAGGIDCLV